MDPNHTLLRQILDAFSFLGINPSRRQLIHAWVRNGGRDEHELDRLWDEVVGE